MPTVSLDDLTQPALIVKAKTGIIYTNQTDGIMCNHPSQEGFLIILPKMSDCRIFNPDYWYSQMPALDDALYDELEGVLDQYSFWNAREIRIDRGAKNEEAWIHVTFRGDLDGNSIFAGGFVKQSFNEKVNLKDYPTYEGVLTWENCD